MNIQIKKIEKNTDVENYVEENILTGDFPIACLECFIPGFPTWEAERDFIKENVNIILIDEKFVYYVNIHPDGEDASVERCKINSRVKKIVDSVSDDTESNDGDNMDIKIEKVKSGSAVSDDIVVSKDAINVIFKCEDDELSIRIDVEDMDFEEIDFDDAESISDKMKDTAVNKMAVLAVEHLVDCELLTGEIGEDFVVEDECGDASSIMHSDFCQMHDIFMMMSYEDSYVLAKSILKKNGFEQYTTYSEVFNSSEELDENKKVYLVNAFTPNMLDIETVASGFNVEFTPISKEDGLSLMTDSAIGHEDFAELLGVPYNRINLTLKRGDVFILAQRVGERLPEGTTTLTEDVNIVFLKGVVQ